MGPVAHRSILRLGCPGCGAGADSVFQLRRRAYHSAQWMDGAVCVVGPECRDLRRWTLSFDRARGPAGKRSGDDPEFSLTPRKAMDPPPHEVTRLLNEWCNGDPVALEQLAPVVESELRRLARIYLKRETPGGTLQPTALINEAYLRLIEWNGVQ